MDLIIVLIVVLLLLWRRGLYWGLGEAGDWALSD